MRRLVPVVLTFVLLAGCGGGSDKPRLRVSAATSLKTAATAYGGRFGAAEVALSFGGSDELAAQIRQGTKPGVFAAANTQLPDQLRAEGLVQEPRAFATNELVVAVRPGASIDALEDLAQVNVTIGVGAPSVPVGGYTRDVLGRLEGAVRQAIEHNVRTREPDVRGVVGKVLQGAVDAGFVYATDVSAAEGRLRAIRLPSRLRPRVAYAAAVVAPSQAAQEYLDGLVSGRCQDELREAGFGAP